MDRLTSLKPFLFTAYYNWLLENNITPHLLVDATMPKVRVPQNYVKDGSIILSLVPSAIADFSTSRRGISFKARFKGVSEDIYIPYVAMEQLIALETGSALPIGKVLEQLDLSPEPEDGDIYPDEGFEDEGPDFELEDDSYPDISEDDPNVFITNSDSYDAGVAEEEKESKDEKKGQDGKSEPGFSFVDE